LKECKFDLRSRVARFENPIVAVKHVVSTTPREKDYTIVHVSFQSTGSTNIQCVNVLRKVSNFVRRRERGRGDNKIVWAIEMNEGREIYLKTYSAVDKVDQMLTEWQIDYISWKCSGGMLQCVMVRQSGVATRTLCIGSAQRVALIGCGN